MGKKALLLLGAGISFFSLAAYASDKKKELDRIVDNLQFQVRSVKNFKFSLKQFSMDVGVRILNPTNESLNINTGFIKASVIRVFEKKTGKLLAFSNLDTSKINLPSGGYYDLPPVHVEIESLTGVQYLLNAVNDNQKEKIIDKLFFELDIKALGKTKTIKF